jgi:hypothetical protein
MSHVLDGHGVSLWKRGCRGGKAQVERSDAELLYTRGWLLEAEEVKHTVLYRKPPIYTDHPPEYTYIPAHLTPSTLTYLPI